MNPIRLLAALAFGSVLVAGCNPNKDQADPAAEDPAATTAPSDVPPPSDTQPATPPADPMAPSTDPMAPAEPPPTDPSQEPPPPPNG